MGKMGSILLGLVIALQISLGIVWGKEIPAPEIESGAAVVMDKTSGEILYEKNGEQLYDPASITKLLTALVVAEHCELKDTVIFSYDAVYDVEAGSGNKLGLEAGDKLTVEDCLYAMLLESSNQAANALAEYTAGSRELFSGYMQQKIQELGCTHSVFVNPSGLNDPRQKTSAEEMARIAGAAFSNEVVRRISSAKEYELPPTLNNPMGYSLTMEHQLLNDDETYEYAYAQAGKTGYTSLAGNTLVTLAGKEDKELIAVVLKSQQTHYEDTIRLFDYGFQILEEGKLMPVKSAVSAEHGTEDTSGSGPEQSTEQTAVHASHFPWGAAIGAVTALLLAGVVFMYLRIIRHRRRRRRRGRTKKSWNCEDDSEMVQ